MLTIKIKDQEVAKKIHESLIGYKPYIDSEIVLSNDTGEFELIIGNENESDYTLEV